jgi:hypothetical protein
MTNDDDEGMTKHEPHCHPERSRRVPLSFRKGFATGFLDVALNDRGRIRHWSFLLRHLAEQEHEHE